jgi:hypothetical protein
MTNHNDFSLDDAINSLKHSEPPPDQVQAATNRVLDALQSAHAPAPSARLRSEDDFNSLLPAYIRGELSEAQRLLVEDHLASHPSYRHRLDALRGNTRVLPIAPPSPRSAVRTLLPWAIAASLLLTTGYLASSAIDRLLAPAGPRAEIARSSGQIFKLTPAGLQPLSPGSPLEEGVAIRTAKASSAIVRLPDGSLIEMNERAELSISAAFSGSTIHLDRGNILVQAAKQRRGSLKVATRQSTVSVKGTIFSVSTGLRGTQVAVVEGHVVVEQSGQREDLFPGQVTASQPLLRRVSVTDQIAWSQDSARYNALLAEFSQISRQIQALPLPSLRHSSRLIDQLPADTVVYAAIPNISATIADSARIFDDRTRQSPVLQQWWNTEKVSQARLFAEKLRSLGSLIGDEIVLGATRRPGGGISEPFLLTETKANPETIEHQIRELHPNQPLHFHGSFLSIGSTLPNPGFARSPLAATVQKCYQRGAGWILAVDLEQILASSVLTPDATSAASLSGMNNLRHLLVEHRDLQNKANTSATVSFSSPRAGIAAWLAPPAPMPSLDYISPEATLAASAVTKDARSLAEDFFAALGANSAAITELERQLGISILEDLAGPLGGEVTLAVDGPLVPVPAYILSAEVYDPSRLTGSLRRIASRLSVDFSESNLNNRRFFTLKHASLPVELNFTFDGGYMVGAPSRQAVLKAIQTRNTLLSLPRSQRFLDLLPADSQVHASAILFADLNVVKSALSSVTSALPNSGPVLITAYAGPDSITVLSSSGFFGLGIDTLLSAGAGLPILPQLRAAALPSSANIRKNTLQ